LSNFSQCTLDNEAFLGQVQILYDNGARKFWIHGTGALGCLPALVVREKGEHDANGCLAGVNRAAKAYNKKLSQLCDEMRFHLKGATVVYTDMFAIKYDFVANHTKYGMKFCWFRHSEKKRVSVIDDVLSELAYGTVVVLQGSSGPSWCAAAMAGLRTTSTRGSLAAATFARRRRRWSAGTACTSQISAAGLRPSLQ
jgi:hypothetical protein